MIELGLNLEGKVSFLISKKIRKKRIYAAFLIEVL